MTSGTTGRARGLHCFRTTETYRAVALDFGARALRIGAAACVVVSLAPAPDRGESLLTPSSSLAFMMRLFQESWDARAFEGGEFDVFAPERWLVRDQGVEVAGLERAARRALERGEALVVLATAFALVGLLDALGGRRIEAPSGTAVMVTGGYKGRSRELDAGLLRRDVAGAFGIPESHVVGEYGMTELTSQLYEGTLPGASLDGPPGMFLEPPWLRVEPVDPVTLEPVEPGATGIARIVDLANVDSAVAIQTDDIVRRTERGIELVGRREGAEPRGCSLATEALLA